MCTKRNHCTPANRSVPDVQEQRANWNRLLAEHDTKNLVFLDESGVNINLTRRYGRAKGGARVCDDVPLATPKNTTVLSSIRTSGECVYTTYSGGTTTEKFIEYLEKHLLPTLDKEKDVLIMDNMRTHHANAVQTALAASGVKVLFLPPYSPDLNPIERLWSKMKAILRHEKIRSADELSDAVARAFSCISHADCLAWFRIITLAR